MLAMKSLRKLSGSNKYLIFAGLGFVFGVSGFVLMLVYHSPCWQMTIGFALFLVGCCMFMICMIAAYWAKG